ncbi:MAG: gliding motility-associated C-terminal domain-containing protein [Bacteroidota bacterium]
MKIQKTLLLMIAVFAFSSVFSQRGKDGARTVSVANTIVNEYTNLTADATAGNLSITVAASGLNANGRFSGNLAAGDLILIIQMQGATIDGVLTGGVFGMPNDATWGSVLSYNNCGNYELAEVASVPNATTINLTCGLRNSYTNTGRTQVVRVPRNTTLTINSPGTITGQLWNGTTGGIVVTETSVSTTINAGASINATAIGFRGGANTENNSFIGGSYFASTNNSEGAVKGEGIGGFQTDYDPYGGQFCMGAAANAGGGGTAHNAGGGGGANGGVVASWNGNGNPDNAVAGWTTAWNLEAVGFSGNTSSGGGRGGYSFSNSNQNATTTGPGNAAWGGDNRRVRGGLGGRPLDYSTGKIFMGGGGGAGDMNDGDGGPGGRGGGIVLVVSHGTVSGTGSILSSGANGSNSDNSSPPITSYSGIDAAGGAGGGGAVLVNSTGTISGISITANGGNGGNQNFAAGGLASPTYNPAYGPGGGGGGGYIAISNGAITRTANGGNNGTTNSSGLTEFPPNGATRGGAGTNNAAISNYALNVPVDTITICSGNTATFTATITGTLPPGANVYWYTSQFGTASVGSGLTFTTPSLVSNTIYYVGVCPGFYRIPVWVIISPAITINTSGMSITNATCGSSNGSINGITVSGGTNPLTYLWNGVSTGSPNLTGAPAGSYTLVVNDGAGCSATVGPYNINNSASPTINTTNMVITNTSCGNNNGGISGITVSGGTGSYTYQWNGVNSTLNISSQPSGSYTLQVTDGAGCTATAGPFTINPSSNPSINTTNMVITNTSCGNNNGGISGIVVTGGTGGYTYQWNGVNSTLNITNQPAGSYTLLVTDGAGCTATAGPFTINPSTSPSINTTNMVITNTTCGNSNGGISGITVSGGTGSYTYQWNGVNSTLNIANQPAGSYTLQVTDGAGCTATAGPFTINPSASPSINITSMIITNTTCGNNNGGISGITVSGGTGSYTYQWNGVNSTLNITNQPAGSYTLQVTDGAGCTATAGPFTINPSSVPVLDGTNIFITDATCGSNNGAISGITVSGGSGGNTFTWNGSPSTIDISGQAAGSYTLIVTDNSGCQDTLGPVNINSTGGATIDDSNMILTQTTCGNNNGSITGITATGGTNPLTIEWNGSVSTIDISGLTAGTYTLEVTDGSGCVSLSGPYTINASSSPALSISGADASCNGYNDGSATASTASGASPYSYQWTGGPSTATYNNLTAGTYTCTVTDSAGCTDTETITISEPAPLNTSVAGTTTICTGQSTTLTASGGTIFNWSTSETTASITVSPASTTTYSVIITSTPCADTVSVTVTVNSTPVAVISGDTSICTGQPTTLTASGGTSFLWSNGSTSSTITIFPGSDTTYTVAVSNNCGADTTGVNVVVNSPPVADAGPDVSIGIGNSTTLTGNGGVNYSWSPSADLSCTNCQSTDASPLTTTTYTVTVTDANGCTASDDVTVTVDGTFVIFIPDAFSPNGDNNNEELFVRGSGIEKFEFNVYDRWGQKVFTTSDQQTGWDGTFKGEKLNSAVFVYTLEGNYIGGETFSLKGNITLYR